MPIAFFVSSAGDTDLAKASIAKMFEWGTQEQLFIIPLTKIAADRTKDLSTYPHVKRLLPDYFKKKLSEDEVSTMVSLAIANNIDRAYIGVPSPNDEESAFQIAEALLKNNIACTIAYEFMFTAPKEHKFWNYIPYLSEKENCDLLIPLESATQAMPRQAKIQTAGHLSIDRSVLDTTANASEHRKTMCVTDVDDLIFVSGTTQPTDIDNTFLEALLNELTTGKYPTIQIRFGLHPGIKNSDDENALDKYLQTLLTTCEKYPSASNQFKLILSPKTEATLKNIAIKEGHSFILRSDIAGENAAAAANKVTQAVPGALLNQAAFRKPAYFHNKTAKPYLPISWFSKDIPTFFNASTVNAHTKEELELTEDCASTVAKHFR